MRKRNVLVVCNDNIGRSPIIAAVLRKLTNLNVRSVGLDVDLGEAVPEKIKHLSIMGTYDIENHSLSNVLKTYLFGAT